MSARELFDRYFGECPLVGIIRGVTPGEAAEIGQALFDAGIRIIEVPLNSPDPFASIGAIADRLGESALVGAGTVLDPQQVAKVQESGGRIIVSPNMDPEVIAASVASDLVSCPGIFTPTEAFEALRSGAHALKFFPAESASPRVVKALRAVLPKTVALLVVGGVTADSLGSWLDSGASGFGLGSGVYVPGQSAEETFAKATAYVEAVRR